MGPSAILNKIGIKTDRKFKINNGRSLLSPPKNLNNRAIGRLISEGGRDFFRYLKSLDLTDDPNMMVLSSKHQYYYNYHELQCTTTLIILQKLNLIKHIDIFLHSLRDAVSPKTNFIGCFADSGNSNRLGLVSRIYKEFINFLDSRFEREFNMDAVSSLLESQGFQVIDMKLIKGLTYFRARKN